MKLRKCIANGLLTMTMAAAMLFTSSDVDGSVVKAADYTYKVTLSAGNMGTMAGGDIEKTDIKYGESVNFGNPQSYVTVKDDRYYVKGIRLAGRDNEEAAGNPSFTVEGDTDYVVAYGLKGEMVKYTVNYVDASGNKLADSEEFYGAAGDKPVVAYQYVEGYHPQAFNLTKTLVSDESENVFNFVYEPGEVNVITHTVTVDGGTRTITTTQNVPGATTTTTRNGGNAGGTGAGTAGGNAGGTGAGGGNAGGNGNGVNVTEVEDGQTPQGLVDLDDGETPKADIDAESGNIRERSVLPIILGGCVALAAIIALIGGMIYFKKRRES